MKRLCRECLAWCDWEDGSGKGECRRNAPTAEVGFDGAVVSRATDWCCEGICRECEGEKAHYSNCSEFKPYEDGVKRVRQGSRP